MRAVLCKAFGNGEGLVVEDVPPPALRPGTARIAVHAAGVNFADTLMVAGTYQEKPSFPFTPGLEIAGEVVEIGEGVAGLRPGDRVLATCDSGGYAEEVVLASGNVTPIPASMDFTTAAGFPVAYGTSHGALDWRARLQPGETLLVHGAAGGVGLTAVEIGKAMGASVIATAGGPEKLAIAKAHGADHLIDYARENIRDRVRELTQGRGADVVYDPVGGDAFDASLRCIAWEGRIIVIGFAGGRVPQIPANLLLVKNCDAIGFYWGSYRKKKPEAVGRSFAQLLAWFEAGKLKPHVSERYDIGDVAEVFRALRTRRATGKVVLTTGRG
ncbi:MAG: NADPH:quinone oxidoreductase family protein [Alphaproteobacteria bacterium]|nr:NADPH:quinone oxidoreductase family protein [Alphaproteobacteria bacterium]